PLVQYNHCITQDTTPQAAGKCPRIELCSIYYIIELFKNIVYL
ncbi:hypothetical protein M2099_000800, partial [Breznakia sp. PFB1-4]|nr:hypothetical protein [Breznakia sp. PFB1-4]